MSSEVTAAVIGGGVALVVAAVTSFVAYFAQRARLRQELRTEVMAESAIVQLLKHPQWEQRSFIQISARLGGFEDNELRRLLVRAGAVRFRAKGVEYWGLVERNRDSLNLRDSEAAGLSARDDSAKQTQDGTD